MSLIKIGDAFRRDTQEWIEHWEADTKVELGNIPKCNYGSTCTIRSTGEKYSVDEAGVWSFVGGGSGTSGLPSGSSPNQYLVTDGEGNAKWEDKLCWIEGGLETVFPKQTISNYTKHELGGYFVAVHGVGAVIEAGKTYRVTVDDAVFESVAQAEGENQVYVGNLDMGIGFVYIVLDDCLYINTDDDTPRQIRIEVDNETIHPIDKKYLPSGGGATTVYAGHPYFYHDVNLTQPVTKAELFEMANNGAIWIVDLPEEDPNSKSIVNSVMDFGEHGRIRFTVGTDSSTLYTSEFVDSEG